MIEINNKRLCENCFAETDEAVCPHCGYTKNKPPKNDQMLPPGTILNGKYVVGKSLGSGGFGITYLGYNVSDDKKIAIKEYFPKTLVYRKYFDTTVMLSRDEQYGNFEKGREAFFEEAKTLSRFNGNPNIVSVYEFFLENDTAYFVMEYLEGRDLRKYIADRGSNLTSDETREMMKAIASALNITHNLDVLHRDVSNVNVFICNDGTYKLIDFGSARQYSVDKTQSMSVILNPGFAPLEQYQRHGKQGPWTDIYALGATAYWALTGELLDDPMTRLNSDKLMSIKGTDIDPELFRIIRKCIGINIKSRYQDVTSLIKDLNKKSRAVPIIRYAAVSAAIAAVITAGAVFIGGALNKDEPTWTPPEYESEYPSDAESEAPTEAVVEAPTEVPKKEPNEDLGDKATEYPTEDATEAPEEELTETTAGTPSEKSTQKPTEKPTEAQTKKPAEKPTEAPTEAQTEKPTQKPTEKPTEAQTEKPTQKPTEKPTEAQTEKPTQQPTEKPTETQTEKPAEKPHTHSYGAWSNGGTTHSRTCSCGNRETEAHTYDGGKVTKEPTETTEGVKTYTCTKCGATKTETIAKTEATPDAAEYYQTGIDYQNRGDYATAFEWYTKAAELGNTSAMYMVAAFYFHGIGDVKEIDYETAFEWFLKAAEHGHDGAMFVISANYYGGELLGVKDYAKAFEWCKKAANLGHPDAMAGLGYYYENGLGVTQDYNKAFEWYKKAADTGLAYAMSNVGSCYENGYGVTQDYAKALEWYEKAKAAGYDADKYIERVKEKMNAGESLSADECYEKAREYRSNGDYEQAFEWYKKAAELGHVDAMYSVGDFYDYGLGVEQDCAKAFEWFSKTIANGGFSYAMIRLGRLYEWGEGVEQDYYKALEWYEKAKAAGEDADLHIIGVKIKLDIINEQDAKECYNTGEYYSEYGTNSQALEWYLKAANLGHVDAMVSAGDLYNGTSTNNSYAGIPQDYNKALEWYTKAANSGHAYAMHNVGIYYEYGRGVTVDYAKALEWYEKSKAAGYEYADIYISRVKEKMNG